MSSPSSDKKQIGSNMPNKGNSPCFDSPPVSGVSKQIQRFHPCNSLSKEVDDKPNTEATFDTKENCKERKMSPTIEERYALCKKNLRISLTKEEIEEDLVAMTGKKPPAINKIREETVRRNLNVIKTLSPQNLNFIIFYVLLQITYICCYFRRISFLGSARRLEDWISIFKDATNSFLQ